jgi:hypothetical protein
MASGEASSGQPGPRGPAVWALGVMDPCGPKGPPTDLYGPTGLRASGPLRAYGPTGPRAYWPTTGLRAQGPTDPPGHDMDGARKERDARDLTI